MSIVAIHDRIMDAAKIESAVILLPSGSWRKQNFRGCFRVHLSAGCGYPPKGTGCPPGRSGRPFRRLGYLSGVGEPLLSAPGGALSGPEAFVSGPGDSFSERR